MDALKYKFSEDDITQLQEYRDNQSDVRLKIRFIAMLMQVKDFEIREIASIVGKSIKTIENWHNQYTEKGIDSLNSFSYTLKQAFIRSEQIEEVITWVSETNPSKIKEVREYIRERFKVTYSTEAVRKLLKKNGLKVLRPKIIPGNAPSEDEQKKTIENYFDMKASCEPGTVFLFGDGMHLVHQNVPGLCWGDPKNPPVLKTNTGRQRLNILGAYDPDSYSFVHLTGEENCNADRAIEFFEVIINAYLQAPLIVLFLDNASYFKAEIVTKWLEDHPKLQIEFLPPYSPNLNLIERLWRFVKEKLVKNTYYKKYKTFRAKVFQLLNHIDEHVDELRTLMVEKFEIIKTQA